MSPDQPRDNRVWYPPRDPNTIPIRTEEEIARGLQVGLRHNIDLNVLMQSYHPSQYKLVKKIAKEVQTPRSGRALFLTETESGYKVRMPANFLPSWINIYQGLGELIITKGPKLFTKGMEMYTDPAEYADSVWRATTYVPRVGNQLLRELLMEDSEELQSLREAHDGATDPALRAALAVQLDRRYEAERPLLGLLSEMYGSLAVWSPRGRERFMQQLADDPAALLMDIAGVAMTIGTGGKYAGVAAGLKGTKAMRLLDKAMRVINAVESAPLRAGPGIYSRLTRRGSGVRRAPEAGMSDDAIREIGRQYDLKPRERFRTDEQGAHGGIERSYDAGVDASGRLPDELSEVSELFDARSAGAQAMKGLDETQVENRIRASGLSDLLDEHGERTLSPEFGVEAKLQGIIDDLRGGDSDARAAANILERELNLMREAGGSINEMSLRSLLQLRTNFRKGYKDQFLSQVPDRPTQMGTGSPEEKTYNRISAVFDEGIGDTVARSPDMDPEIGASMKAGDQLWRDRARLESSVGGQLLFDNKDNPIAVIDGILEDKKVTTEQLDNIYQLLGDDAAGELRAGLVLRILEKAPQSPKGLQDYLGRIRSSKDKEFLTQMFGGGDNGTKAVAALEEMAEFAAQMAPADRMYRNSPTGNVDLYVNEAEIRGLLGAASDLAEATLRKGGDDLPLNAGFATLGFVKSAVPSAWKQITENAEWTRKALVEGAEIPDGVKRALSHTLDFMVKKKGKSVELRLDKATSEDDKEERKVRPSPRSRVE